jgi:hypothetical protein
MTIEFHCPHCDKLLKTADDKAGVRANCPGCGETVVVPTAGESSALADPSSRSGAPVPAGAGPPPLPPTASGAVTGIGDATKSCPMCGEQIKAAATRCRYCGEDLTTTTSRAGNLAPHRGGLILAFGLIGFLLCLPFGIAAWVMGNNDLREMAAGRMDRAGEGLTQAGKIIGIVTCCLALLMFLFYAVVIVIAILGNVNH